MKKPSAIQEMQEVWLGPWVGKIPWRRGRQTPPVFLPEESHGQRSLVGCGPQGLKVSDTTEDTGIHRLINP